MKKTDEREDFKKYPWLVVMKDSFMSGWGEAEGGISYAAWACEKKNVDSVKNCVKNRTDCLSMFVVFDDDGTYRPSQGKNDHFSVYIADDHHKYSKEN